MTQEVRVMVQLTLEVDANVPKELIKDRIDAALNVSLIYPDMELKMTDIIEIRKEAEIYGTED